MNSTVATSYNIGLVIISYLISVTGAFIALTCAGRIQPGRGNAVSIACAGLALGGIGVWSMHFIAMLALRMDVGLGYSMWETGISLVAAIALSALAFRIVAYNPRSHVRLLSAGTMLGLGAVVMHYLGMYGMRFGGIFEWNYPLVALSVLIALVAATAALWLAFNTRTIIARLLAACVMGVAVCAMHYTGMAAADFVCTTSDRLSFPTGSAILSVLELPMLVITLAVGMATALAIDLFFQAYLMRPSQRQQHGSHWAMPEDIR
jgi:NO-binding membrane sensor protein with MHYT domain